MYQILSVDYDEAAYAEVFSDGEIQIKFHIHSSVPHKHSKGGQSKTRFQHNRENEIVLWFKRINEYLKEVQGEIYIGISKVYYKQFLRYQSTYNKEKIKERLSCEYAGATGIYQLVKKLEEKKIVIQ